MRPYYPKYRPWGKRVWSDIALLPQRARQILRRKSLSGQAFSLYEGFSGELFFSPDIIPVCLDFRRMIQDVHIKPRHLFTLTPRQFEEFVAEIWRNLGY